MTRLSSDGAEVRADRSLVAGPRSRASLISTPAGTDGKGAREKPRQSYWPGNQSMMRSMAMDWAQREASVGPKSAKRGGMLVSEMIGLLMLAPRPCTLG